MVSKTEFLVALVAATGLVTLLGLAMTTNIPTRSLASLSIQDAGQRVQTEGIIHNLQVQGKRLMFELKESGKLVRVVVFRPDEEALAAGWNGTRVRVVGTVSNYQGRLEILAERVAAR